MKSRLIFAMVALLLLGVVGVFPALAQNGAVWNVSFYNNTTLTDPVVLNRQESQIAANWGNNSPGNGVNADGFSARWGTDVYLPAGTYRFWLLADDNARITIDFGLNPLIDTFQNASVGQVVSADINLGAGTHHIQVDYREVTGNAYIFVDWANLSLGETGPDFQTNAPQPPVVNPGTGTWIAQYYSNATLSGSPQAIITETSPTHNWGTNAPLAGLPADNFSVRWSSSQVLNTGNYRLTVRADDGVRVYVNGGLVINEWHGATNQTYTADIYLPGGTHSFLVEYYEAGGAAFLEYNLSPLNANPPTPIPPINTGGSWIAYYFNNTDLAGSPTAILSEASPSHNWGSAAPLASVPGDNFSVRWTNTQNLGAGTYRASVRADDGVRVYVNGQLVINEWHGASGQVYSADVNLSAGQHTITVEYYEAGGDAFIDFSFGLADSGGGQVNPPANTGASAVVTAFRLNVRNQPTASGSTIVTKINRGETYPVVGRSANGAWLQLNVNGVVGWSYASFLNVYNDGSVPVTGSNGSNQPPASSGFSLAATSSVNIRSQPSVGGSAILGVLRIGQTAPIVGRNASNTWWQVNYNGIVGWVSGGFIQLQSGADIDRIPVTR